MLVANFLFSRKMLTFKKGKQISFSFSMEKFMIRFLDDEYALIDLHDQQEKTMKICHEHKVC